MSFKPVAVITGAGSGIGEATALRFAKEGWDIVLIGRRLERLEQTAKSFSNRAQGYSLPLNVADPGCGIRTSQWLQKNEAVGERICTIVHNAGIYERAATSDSSDELWHRIFETNFFGLIRLTLPFLPYLKANKGSVVNVSSTLGLRPMAETAAYSASKAALVNWTQAFAQEMGPFGVRVNCVCPGIVDTPIHEFHGKGDAAEIQRKMGPLQPLGRIGKPEEVAHMIYTLAGPGSEWTTGAIVSVDGGINLV